MSSTARFALPLLSAGQAQKEMTVNEAMIVIDALVQPCAEEAGVNVPPTAPVSGQCWIVGSAPVGEWTGAAHGLAIWTASGWRFVQAREGMAISLLSHGLTAHYRGGEWQTGIVVGSVLRIADQQVVGARQPAIPEPADGNVIDVEAREAISTLLNTLRSHGLIEA